MQKISMLLFLALFLLSCQPEEDEFTDLNLTVRTEIRDSKEKNDANRIRVRNIEALRKLPFPNPKNRKEVLVLGYYEPGDDGGGIFYWDPISKEEDNGGTIISIQNNETGRWKREYKDTINVKWFGAKGDGNLSDQIPFEKAFKIGLPVVVPIVEKYYSISETLFPKNSVIGEGMPEIRMQGSNGGINKIILHIFDYKRGALHISGLRLNGQYDGVGTEGEFAHCIKVSSSKNVFIHDNYLMNPYGDCVTISTINERFNDYSENVQVNNNTFSNPRRCNVAIISGKDIVIKDNFFESHNNYVAMIDIEPNPVGQINENIIIDGNVFKGGIGSYFIVHFDPNEKVSKGLIIKNNIGEAEAFFISSDMSIAKGTFKDVIIEGNIFFGTSNVGRFLHINELVQNVSIKKNKDYAQKGWLIHKQKEGIIIEENLIDQYRDVGISFIDCENVLFKENIIRNIFATYGYNSINFRSYDPSMKIQNGHRIINNIFSNSNYAINFMDRIYKNVFIDGNYFETFGSPVYVKKELDSEIILGPNNVFVD